MTREIVEALMNTPSPTRRDLSLLKKRCAAEYRLNRIPSNSEIIHILTTDERLRLLPILTRKTTRTISGVTVVAVMTKPHACPQDEPCAYCPGGPPFGVPQSYTGFEPAAMRGLQNQFNSYQQVRSRIRQLQAIGHEVDKVELIIMGGTFSATSQRYQRRFIKRCLDALTRRRSSDIEEAKKNAETSRIRNVGITVETRPDWSKEQHVDSMLNMGVTRVELGVQNPDDDIYSLVGRKHSVADVVDATRVVKDAGLKVAYHLMPGMPGSDPERDLQAFQQIFKDPSFKPDMIKIYPCLVLKGTRAYKWYQESTYRPYDDRAAADLIVEMKRNVPAWVRIMRIQRDIPAQLIIAGVKKSNLRQLVHSKLKEREIRCRCIRCREVGHRKLTEQVEPDIGEVSVLQTEYQASEGQEIFISAEDVKNDLLIAYLRLRIPSQKAHRQEIKNSECSIVRELHVYGPLVPVGKHSAKAYQHKGYGTILMKEAERISTEGYNMKKTLVTSALGTKQYYMRLGYEYCGPYMSRTLED